MLGLLFALFRILPPRLGRAMTRTLARLAFALGIRRRVALENLALAFPELPPADRRRLALRNYLHLGDCAADFLRSPSMGDAELGAMVDAEGWEKVEPCLKAGKGFVVCAAHLGNFELFGVYAARRGVPLSALTRPLKGKVNSLWVGTRALAGIEEIHRGMDNLVDAVKRGRVLGVFIDQNMLLRRAIFVPFCGKLAATTPAPAVIAERTGAPVFLGLMLRRPDGRYRTHFEGPVVYPAGPDREAAVRAFTAELNERLERVVREHPEQWFWLHRRWKTRPPDEGAR